MGDTAVLLEGTMLPLKEESPAGTGLSDLAIFSGVRPSAQSTPASHFTTDSHDLLTETDGKGVIVAPSVVAATIASGTVLSDTLPTTPPYNDDAADYVSRHVATATPAAPADTPTATPPNDEFMEDAASNSESDCLALEDESPYDALYHDSDFADETPTCAKPAAQQDRQPGERRPLETELPANVRRSSTVGCPGKIRDLSVAKEASIQNDNQLETLDRHSQTSARKDERANVVDGDASTVDVGAANEGEVHSNEAANDISSSLQVVTPLRESASQAATPADQESPSRGTPSEDSIATRRPVRMARLAKPVAQESPKPARQAAKPTSSSAVTPTATSIAIKDEPTTATVPERRTSKRVSLAALTATASPIAKQAATSAAKQAAKPSPRSKAASNSAASDAPSPAPRRVTRLSGLPTELSIPQSSPKTTPSGKRRRREPETDVETDLPRELRRLQDTKEFSHVDDQPIIYTVWSNGRYVPANAAGEPLVDKNAAKKARLAKAAEEAEKQRLADEEAARIKEAEEKAAAEAARPPQKRVKKWMSSGIYAGQAMPSNPTAGLTPAERKELAKLPELAKKYPPNKTLPMPIYNGLRMLIQGRDFKMPFDVFNPLPPGQPKPVKYGRFSKNRFVGEAHSIWKKNPNYDDFQSKCVCKPETGCDEDCQNRIMLYECNDEICNVGSERCSNREFQRLADRTASKNPFHIGVEVFKTPNRGHGIRASRAFRPGQIIMEYIGEIITEEESDRRMNELYKDNECYYLMSFDQSLIIDGTSGSIARFVNHSCSPNCRMIKWIVSGQPRIALFAGDRPILTGEELTYDYNFDPYSAKNVQCCLCGAENCRGVLGPRKSEKVTKAAAEKAAAEKAAAEKANGKAKGSGKRKHDAYSMDDDDDTDAPANKKMRVADPPAAPARPIKKPTRAPPPKKVVTTTKAALEALAANAARIARLTKASHAARAARQARAAEKMKALEASKKSKQTKLSKAKATTAAAAAKTAKGKATKATGGASKAVKVVKAAKSVKVVKTAKGLKASKTSVSKEVKTTGKNTKSTKSAVKVTKSTLQKSGSKRAATPPATTNGEASTPQATTPKATPMAQAVAKAAKEAAKAAAAKATKTTKLSKVTKPVKKSQAQVKSISKVKAAAARTKKPASAAAAAATTTVTATATVTTTLGSDSTPVKRGRGRPRLLAKEDELMGEAGQETADDAAAPATEGPDEEEELAAQFATEAAATSTPSVEALDIDGTEDDSTPKPRRARKLTKAQKLRIKRQLIAARRSADRANGTYIPKRRPGRPRKYVKANEDELDGTATPSDAQSVAASPVFTASVAASLPAAQAASPTAARAVKAKIQYAAARRDDVEEFKAARARAQAARLEQTQTAGGNAEGTTNLAEGSASLNATPKRDKAAEDVIHVAPGSRLQV
ncbi:hypothetical protein SBRCBS47491_005085 [Sporothrix bragantina]|uniref:Histone-lysine N-methyltransferase ASH1L n=1 Tax=Sporothrix bragantina TaxID=671064 RepID=A0ABP0BUK9_9PEZI